MKLRVVQRSVKHKFKFAPLNLILKLKFNFFVMWIFFLLFYIAAEWCLTIFVNICSFFSSHRSNPCKQLNHGQIFMYLTAERILTIYVIYFTFAGNLHEIRKPRKIKSRFPDFALFAFMSLWLIYEHDWRHVLHKS